MSALTPEVASAVAAAANGQSLEGTLDLALAEAAGRPELATEDALDAWRQILECGGSEEARASWAQIRDLEDPAEMLWRFAERLCACDDLLTALRKKGARVEQLSEETIAARSGESADLVARLVELKAAPKGPPVERLRSSASWATRHVIETDSPWYPLSARATYDRMTKDLLARDWPGLVPSHFGLPAAAEGELELAGESFALRREQGDWELRSAGSRISISETEARGLGTLGEVESVRGSALQLLGFDDLAGEERLASELGRIKQGWDEDHLAVLIDSSTLANAKQCLEGRVTTWTLLDLATLTHAVATSDVVIVQTSQKAAGTVDELAPGVIAPAWFSGDSYRDELWAICLQAIGAAELDTASGAAPLSAVWKDYLGLDVYPRLEPWGRFLEYENSYIGIYMTWSGRPGFRFKESAPPLQLSGRELNDFLSISTVRTYYNAQVAGLLRVPYLPAAIRGGVQQQILRHKLDQQQTLDTLLGRIGPPPESKSIGGDYARAVSLPLVLGIVLSRLEDPNEYPRVVSEVRAELEPLRRAVADDRRACENPREFLSRYTSRLEEWAHASHPGLTGAGSAAVGVVVAPALGGVAPATSSLIKLVSALGGKQLHSAFDALARPDLHAVTSLADGARGLHSAHTEVKRVFGAAWGRADQDELLRASELPPGDFLRLRSLEP